MRNKSDFIFRRLGVITIIAVYLLILVGGIVRSTGSGMGCPDWPKCFGMWIPPTEIGQLPPNYKELFKVAGKEIADFNAFKTWVEYINRLIGVVIGFLIFLTFVFSIYYFRKDRWITYLSFLSFILVGFQGWIGAKVVASDLAVGIITIHMFIAILIVFLLIYTVARSYKNTFEIDGDAIRQKPLLNKVLLFAISISLLQVFFGTQVREAVDEVSKSFFNQNRELWIEKLGITFYIHRSFSLVILAVHFYLIYILYRYLKDKGIIFKRITLILTIILIVETFTGAMMAYLAIPAFLQPIHLFLAVIAVGIQFLALLLLNFEKVFSLSPLKERILLTD